MQTVGRTGFDFVCEICGAVLKSKTAYTKHINQHKKEETKKLKRIFKKGY